MESPKLDVLMITYNRADYTRLALTRLLDSCDETMRVWVWQNGSDPATLAVVNSLRNHPRFHHLQHSLENKRLREPTNWFWKNSTAPYVSKVDDDCLVPWNWGARLMAAHESNPGLGLIGCWHFYPEDFAPELAEKKIRTLSGNHQVLLNCWIGGSGYVMKRKCVKDLGLIRDEESFPAYCIRLALRGWQNGWYYPFLYQEHMDDPRSANCVFKNDEQFLAQRGLSAVQNNVRSLAEWAEQLRNSAHYVQAADPDPRKHIGWRRKFHGLKTRATRWLGQGRFRPAGGHHSL